MSHSARQGSVYGAFQGYARAFYAEFIPPGEEARWYGLFSITDKASFPSCLDRTTFADMARITVQLIRGSAHCRDHRRHDGEHQIRVLLPRCHDLVCGANPHGGRRRTRARRRTALHCARTTITILLTSDHVFTLGSGGLFLFSLCIFRRDAFDYVR